MGIKLTPKFKIADVIAKVKKRVDNINDVLVDRLKAVGEQFVTDARNNRTYLDRTGNLRSSIGYIIYKDGKPYSENFQQSQSSFKEISVTDGKTGVSKGKQQALLSADIPKQGYCLVVVAGMNYALYVEVYYGYDVITGSSYEAEKNLKQSLEFVRKNL